MREDTITESRWRLVVYRADESVAYEFQSKAIRTVVGQLPGLTTCFREKVAFSLQHRPAGSSRFNELERWTEP